MFFMSMPLEETILKSELDFLWTLEGYLLPPIMSSKMQFPSMFTTNQIINIQMPN